MVTIFEGNEEHQIDSDKVLEMVTELVDGEYGDSDFTLSDITESVKEQICCDNEYDGIDMSDNFTEQMASEIKEALSELESDNQISIVEEDDDSGEITFEHI